MRYKLTEAYYDEDTGVSVARIQTNLGQFSGMAVLNKEDIEVKSNFAGCKLAESRAYIKYLKAKIKNIKIEIKGIQDLAKMLEGRNDYNKNSIENRKLRHLTFIKQNQITEIENKITSIKKSMDDYLEKRILYIDKNKNKGEENGRNFN